jgi:phage tail-like protein
MPGKDEQLYISNAFALEIDSVAMAFFTEVSGLESATDHTEVTQQTKQGRPYIIRVPARQANKPGTLTLKTKSVGAAEQLWKWRKQVVDGKVKEALRNGSVVIYDTENKEIGRWNFVKAWPSKLSIGSLSATSNDAIDVEISIEYEQLTPV